MGRDSAGLLRRGPAPPPGPSRPSPRASLSPRGPPRPRPRWHRCPRWRRPSSRSGPLHGRRPLPHSRRRPAGPCAPGAAAWPSLPPRPRHCQPSLSPTPQSTSPLPQSCRPPRHAGRGRGPCRAAGGPPRGLLPGAPPPPARGRRPWNPSCALYCRHCRCLSGPRRRLPGRHRHRAAPCSWRPRPACPALRPPAASPRTPGPRAPRQGPGPGAASAVS
mmetsp:Transcript_3472/g.9185  ORF Transcript_3472/g.9185 Transcript_3472/m.9185 type:complete len:218 (-) Transcript_3472:79-732(-)